MERHHIIFGNGVYKKKVFRTHKRWVGGTREVTNVVPLYDINLKRSNASFLPESKVDVTQEEAHVQFEARTVGERILPECPFECISNGATDERIWAESPHESLEDTTTVLHEPLVEHSKKRLLSSEGPSDEEEGACNPGDRSSDVTSELFPDSGLEDHCVFTDEGEVGCTETVFTDLDLMRSNASCFSKSNISVRHEEQQTFFCDACKYITVGNHLCPLPHVQFGTRSVGERILPECPFECISNGATDERIWAESPHESSEDTTTILHEPLVQAKEHAKKRLLSSERPSDEGEGACNTGERSSDITSELFPDSGPEDHCGNTDEGEVGCTDGVLTDKGDFECTDVEDNPRVQCYRCKKVVNDIDEHISSFHHLRYGAQYLIIRQLSQKVKMKGGTRDESPPFEDTKSGHESPLCEDTDSDNSYCPNRNKSVAEETDEEGISEAKPKRTKGAFKKKTYEAEKKSSLCTDTDSKSESEDETKKREMEDAKTRKSRCVPKKKSSGGCPRPSRTSKRQTSECPVEGCPAKVVWLSRHLKSCHSEMPKHEIEDTLAEVRASKRREKKEPRRSYLVRVCPLCKKPNTRLDIHLVKVHKISRETERYIELLSVASKADEKSSPSMSEIMVGFGEYLQSYPGTKKTPTQAKDHARTVARIIEDLSEGHFTLSVLKSIGTIGNNGGLVERWRKTLKAGTMLNYLGSLKKFMTWVCGNPAVQAGWTTEMEARKICDHVDGTLKALSKERLPEVIQRQRRERDDLCIDLKLFNGYLNSSKVTDAVRYLSENVNRQPELIDLDTRIQLRDTLLLVIGMSGARRSGDLANLTIQEVNDALHRDSNHIVYVLNHKVKTKSCRMNLKNNLFSALQGYIKHVRGPAVEGRIEYFASQDQRKAIEDLQANDTVFLTGVCTKMTSSAVCKAMQTAWKQWGEEAGVQVPHINTRKIRKTFVTHSRRLELSGEGRATLADAMTHDLKTADTHYDVERGATNTIRATEMMMQWIEEAVEKDQCVSDGSSSGSDEELVGVQEDDVTDQEGETEDVVKTNDVDDVYPNWQQLKEKGVPTPKVRSYTRKWANQEEVEHLRRGLLPYINAHVENTTLTIKRVDVISALVEAGPRFAAIKEKHTDLDIYDKVRYLIAQERKKLGRSTKAKK